MSETWYETRDYGDRIRPVEVERYTGTSVYVNGRRRSRITRFGCCFPTWQEAHGYLLRQSEDKLSSARMALQRAQAEHGNIKGMKPPKESTSERG